MFQDIDYLHLLDLIMIVILNISYRDKFIIYYYYPKFLPNDELEIQRHHKVPEKIARCKTEFQMCIYIEYTCSKLYEAFQASFIA